MTIPKEPIECAFIHFAGEKEAGLPSADFTMELFFDPSCLAENERAPAIARMREQISKLYEEIQGAPPSFVLFDFESLNGEKE